MNYEWIDEFDFIKVKKPTFSINVQLKFNLRQTSLLLQKDLITSNINRNYKISHCYWNISFHPIILHIREESSKINVYNYYIGKSMKGFYKK
jgi:hypothetical protein